ncbi:hypothetical protein OG948_01825 [Embleya sp. NBC_00888]|uniref:hypothetical protein n=1 Tax=Embleya sp. NBC_00888 TaxID=2975960 RepID=UPI00386B0C36|nr:hypothetical protein OG948_01825 [Embleya sp. NBC_00888]
MRRAKAKAQRRVEEFLERARPNDPPVITVMVVSGPTPLVILLTLGVGVLRLRRHYIVVTGNAVLVLNAGMWHPAPREIAHVVPRAVAAASIGRIVLEPLAVRFRFRFPGHSGYTDLSVGFAWWADFESMVRDLTGVVIRR